MPTCGGKGGFVVNSTADGNVTCGACPASAPRYLSAYSACYASCPSMYPSLYINTQPSPVSGAAVAAGMQSDLIWQWRWRWWW